MFIINKTILETNLEAAKEIGKQIRLRNLSGIIVIDFIDMRDKNQKEVVMDALKESLKLDKGNVKIFPFTQLDLAPNLILLDMSISSSFNAQGIGRYSRSLDIGIKNKDIMGNKIDDYDIRIAYSHPYEKYLKFPSPKGFMLANYILSQLTGPPYKMSFDELFDSLNPDQNETVTNETKKNRISRYIARINEQLNFNKDKDLIIE